MRTKSIFPAVLFAACLFRPAIAAESGWIYVGIGQQSCGTYSLAFQDASPSTGITYLGHEYFSKSAAFEEWVAGYVSGVNMGRRSINKQINVDLDGIALSVKKICDEHPDWHIIAAVSAFINLH
jgi:hypothetical protein